MKKILALLLAVTMLACLFAGCGEKKEDTSAGSDSQPETTSDYDAIVEKGTMIVGITDFAPMDYRDENGEWTGFDAELARLVAEQLGVECEFIEIDWDNKIMELDAGTIDCTWNGMTLTDEVLNSMECTEPYAINAQVIVMPSDKASEYTDVESMKDLSFAVEAGSAGAGAAADNGFENVTEVAAQADALLEVASGTADACIIDLTMANAMTGEGTSYEDLVQVLELGREEYGIGFRKGSDMAQKVDEILDSLREDGTMQELADKYELTLAE